MRGVRTPGKFNKHGELNCGNCVHFWEETTYSEASMYGKRYEGCKKNQSAVHSGGNCRHWKPAPTTEAQHTNIARDSRCPKCYARMPLAPNGVWVCNQCDATPSAKGVEAASE